MKLVVAGLILLMGRTGTKMSVSLLEVIEYGGYDLTTYEDATWLLSKQSEFEELIEQAQDLVDREDEAEDEIAEREYKEEASKAYLIKRRELYGE